MKICSMPKVTQSRSDTLEINLKAKRKEQLRRVLSNIRRVLGVGHGITWLYMMTEALGVLGAIIIAVELLFLLTYVMLTISWIF